MGITSQVKDDGTQARHAAGMDAAISRAQTVILDEPTGRRGTVADFVGVFTRRWAAPLVEFDRFLDLLSPEVRLVAPLDHTSVGRAAGLRSLRTIFAALPDFRAEVDGWAVSGDQLFVEMRFFATIGGRPLTWPNVDRFTFVDGLAVERHAFFDPLPLLLAALRRPSGWRQLARLSRRARA